MRSIAVCRQAYIAPHEDNGLMACLCVANAADPEDLTWFYYYPTLHRLDVQWDMCSNWLAKAVGAVLAGMKPPDTKTEIRIPLRDFEEQS